MASQTKFPPYFFKPRNKVDKVCLMDGYRITVRCFPITDLMFDAIKFGVAIATEDAFDAYGTGNLHYSYSRKYEKPG